MLIRWPCALLFSTALLAFSAASATEPPLRMRAAEIRAELALQLSPRYSDTSDLQPYQEQLSQAVEALAAFLETANPEVAAGWREYLQWDDLVEQLAKPKSNTKVLKTVLLAFRRYHSGLDLDPFRQVQAALREYIHETDVQEAMSQDGQFDRCLENLANSLARYERQPNYEDSYRVGRELYSLERSIDSGHEAIQSIQNRFMHPNTYGRISLRLVNRLLSRDVRDEMIINDFEDGRRTRGQAITTAHLKAALIESGQQAAIDLILEGKCRAPSTITQQGPITVHGSFITNVSARKRIHLNKEGISFQPAEARCSTSVRIHDVEANRRILERIARRRAPQQKPEAEAAVSQKTSRRVESQLNQQAETALEEVNQIFIRNFRTPNRCYGTFPSLMQFSTTPRELQLHARAADEWQLGAPDAAPALNLDHDLGFAIHESMIGNYAEGLFGGKQITDKQWLNCLNTLTGSEPRALWVHDRTDRWALTFSDTRPIVVRFHNGQFQITVRSQQITREGQSHQDLIDISTAFRMQITADGPVLFREEEVSVAFVDGRTPDTEQQKLLDFIHWKFGAIMPKELYFDGLVPPTGGSLSMLRNLQPKEFSFQNGWIKIGYQLISKVVDPS